ncbi:MAG: biotin--[acetyl-CoA-carboxylase] ligase [bacterium]
MYIGTKIEILEKVDSSNSFLKTNYSKYPDGSIIIAKIQTEGRGRFSRKWVSDIKGNLYCSILLKDISWLKNPVHLPVFISVILRRTIVSLVNDVPDSLGFKWPNDLLIDGAKLSGILIESGDGFFVLGIGVNIKKAPILSSGYKTSSLSEVFFKNEEIKTIDFINNFVYLYNNGVDAYVSSGFSHIKEEWERYCIHINKKVDLNEGLDNNTRKETVLFKKLSDDGGAVVLSDSGKERVIYYGELSL